MNEEELFYLAQQQPDVAARAAFLDQACANQSELRARLDKLLKAHDTPASLFDKPAIEMDTTLDSPAGSSSDSGNGEDTSFAATPLTQTPGMRIGPYKLLQKIDEGGMGVVWLAEQEQPVRRQVALKILKPEMDSRQVIARFEQERQALALMDHVNIAKVLDAGTTENGRPYFVMELIRGLPISEYGIPITQYCDDKQLTVRERLGLFVPVCQAIQHAHQKGIIHRDIKPSNVLVTLCDGKPVPKVIDFGVAKAIDPKLTERTLFRELTEVGALIGTLEYMSPEQADLDNLDIDTRSDIYSLGALLYELLTGTLPLDKKRMKEKGVLKALQLIREEEPPKPSTRLLYCETLPAVAAARKTEPMKLTKLVCGELDLIVMKALEKDRTQRYETVNGLARNVEHYLAGEPVPVYPPSTWYRFRKFARRNQTALVMCACILLAPAGMVGGVGWAVRDRMAREAALDHTVATRLDEAETLEREAQKTPLEPDKYHQAWDAARMAAEIAKGASDAVRGRVDELVARLEREEAGAERDRRLLTALLEVQNPHELPGFKPDGNNMMTVLAEPTAEEQFAAAFLAWGLDVYVAPTAEAVARLKARPAAVVTEVIAALDEWASQRGRDGKRKAAGRVAELAAALDDDASSPRRELREILARGRRPIERALGVLSTSLRPVPVPMVVSLGKDRTRLRQLAEKIDPSAEPALGLLTLTRALRVAGEEALAEQQLRAALTARPQEVVLYRALGQLLIEQEPPRWAEAVECYRATRALRPDLGVGLAVALTNSGHAREALDLLDRMVHESPDNPILHIWRGLALEKQGKYVEAEEAFRKAIDIKPDYADAYANLGYALHGQKKHAEAEAAYRKAIALNPDVAGANNNLALTLYVQGKYVEAEAALRKAIALESDSAVAYCTLGWFRYRQGRYAEAETACRKAIALEPYLAGAYNNLGIALDAQKKHAEAEAAFRKAIELMPDQRDLAISYSNLGIALYRQGKHAEAEVASRKAIALKPDHAEAYGNLGSALYRQGKHGEAEAACRKAIELMPDQPDLAISYSNLGAALYRQGKHAEAEVACRKAIALKPDHAEAYSNLGNALQDQGRRAEAEVAYRKAIELEPDVAETYCNLGSVLRSQGRFKESLAAYRRGHELGAKRSDRRYPYLQWVREAEQLVELEKKPANVQSLMTVARMATHQHQQFLATVRFLEQSLAANPDWAERLPGDPPRYYAACCAVMAGAGKDRGAGTLDAAAQRRLRQQALSWLRNELDRNRRRLAKGTPEDRAAVAKALAYWKVDGWLAAVHDAAPVDKLPQDERDACRKLWADVDDLLQGTKDK